MSDAAAPQQAEDAPDVPDVVLQHEKKKYTAVGVRSVAELAAFVATVVGVPVKGQRLISKGKVLSVDDTDTTVPLPAKVMVMGVACRDTASVQATLDAAAAELARHSAEARKRGHLPKAQAAPVRALCAALSQIELSPTEPLDAERKGLLQKLKVLLETTPSTREQEFRKEDGPKKSFMLTDHW